MAMKGARVMIAPPAMDLIAAETFQLVCVEASPDA
jgi:hypothetical protein